MKILKRVVVEIDPSLAKRLERESSWVNCDSKSEWIHAALVHYLNLRLAMRDPSVIHEELGVPDPMKLRDYKWSD